MLRNVKIFSFFQQTESLFIVHTHKMLVQLSVYQSLLPLFSIGLSDKAR